MKIVRVGACCTLEASKHIKDIKHRGQAEEEEEEMPHG